MRALVSQLLLSGLAKFVSITESPDLFCEKLQWLLSQYMIAFSNILKMFYLYVVLDVKRTCLGIKIQISQ